MTSHPVVLDTVDVPARRGLDLLVLDHVRIQAWDRILFVECGDGWIAEEAWRRALRAYVCGLDTSLDRSSAPGSCARFAGSWSSCRGTAARFPFAMRSSTGSWRSSLGHRLSTQRACCGTWGGCCGGGERHTCSTRPQATLSCGSP